MRNPSGRPSHTAKKLKTPMMPWSSIRNRLNHFDVVAGSERTALQVLSLTATLTWRTTCPTQAIHLLPRSPSRQQSQRSQRNQRNQTVSRMLTLFDTVLLTFRLKQPPPRRVINPTSPLTHPPTEQPVRIMTPSHAHCTLSVSLTY